MYKILWAVIRALITVCVCAAGLFILDKYEYLTAFNDIDNILGIIPVAFVLIFISGAAYLLWTKHDRRQIPVTVTVAALMLLSVVLFPTALRGNWWINPKTTDVSEAAPDISGYAPFSGGLADLGISKSDTLWISENQPVLDGATALYPVYAAFAEAVYDEGSFSYDTVLCTNTQNAYEAIIAGKRDVIFAAEANTRQTEAAKAAGADLYFTPIGREAFVFITGSENPVDNLTHQQLRNIYSGKTAYWSTLGWRGGGRIIAFRRPEGSGSQTGLENAVMRNLPVQVPQPLPDESLIGTNSLMKQVSVKWQGVQPALGYSYRFFATAMNANPDAKLLKINGSEPSVENIRNGSYPFTGNFYAVTNGAPSGNAKLLIDWILSPEGQEIIYKIGYVPLADCQ